MAYIIKIQCPRLALEKEAKRTLTNSDICLAEPFPRIFGAVAHICRGQEPEAIFSFIVHLCKHMFYKRNHVYRLLSVGKYDL